MGNLLINTIQILSKLLVIIALIGIFTTLLKIYKNK